MQSTESIVQIEHYIKVKWICCDDSEVLIAILQRPPQRCRNTEATLRLHQLRYVHHSGWPKNRRRRSQLRLGRAAKRFNHPWQDFAKGCKMTLAYIAIDQIALCFYVFQLRNRYD